MEAGPSASVVPARSPWRWVLRIALALSLLLNLVLFLMVGVLGALLGGGIGDGLSETTLRPGDVMRRVMVLPLTGEIGGQAPSGYADSEQILARLQAAANDDSVVGVVLAIDTPGGGVGVSDELHLAVRVLSQLGKPVIAHMGDVCASGGVYVAVACDEIIASPTGITGSIGVVMVHLDLRELVGDRLGVRVDPITSGAMKDLGSPFREMQSHERALLQAMVDQLYQRFLGLVVEGRRGKGSLPADVDAALAVIKPHADGRIMLGPDAVALGLADREGRLDDAIDAVINRVGGTPSVVRVDRPPGLANLFSALDRSHDPRAVLMDRAVAGPRFAYRWQPLQ